jgi:hypothetical protein
MIIAMSDISSDGVSSSAQTTAGPRQPNQQDALTFESIAARQKEKTSPDEEDARADNQRDSNPQRPDTQAVDSQDRQRSEDGVAQDRLGAAVMALAWQPPAAAFASSLGVGASGAPAGELLSWDVLSNYVDRLLVNSQPNSSGPAAVLTLSEDVLPGTTLALSRVQDGWVLHAATPNEAVFRQLQAHLAQLRERFERRNLGALNLEVLVEAIS